MEGVEKQRTRKEKVGETKDNYQVSCRRDFRPLICYLLRFSGTRKSWRGTATLYFASTPQTVSLEASSFLSPPTTTSEAVSRNFIANGLPTHQLSAIIVQTEKDKRQLKYKSGLERPSDEALDPYIELLNFKPKNLSKDHPLNSVSARVIQPLSNRDHDFYRTKWSSKSRRLRAQTLFA